MDLLDTPGERIKMLRRAHSLTQRELSEQLAKQKGIKIGVSFLSQIESGTKQPSLELAQGLADVLNATLDYIFLRSDDPSPRPEDNSIVVDTATPEERRVLRIIIDEVQAVSPNDQELIADMVRLFTRGINRRRQGGMGK